MKKLISALTGIVSLFTLTPVSQAISYQETISSTVYIQIQDSLGDWYSGSGVIISNDALVLTAAHVIMDYNTNLPAEYIDICTVQSEYTMPDCRYSGAVLAYNEYLDLAIVYPDKVIDELGNEIGEKLTVEEAQNLYLPYVDISDYEPSLGDDISVLGFPGAVQSPTITLTQGKISNFTPYDDEFNMYYATDATINEGNSGGPVYNAEEKLIGIAVAILKSEVGNNYGVIVAGDMIYLWFWDLVDQGILNKTYVEDVFANDYAASDSTVSSDINWEELDYKDNINEEPTNSNTDNENTKADNDTNSFKDVFPLTKNSSAIEYLKNNGIINGYQDGTFKPFNQLNRAELLKILVEGAGYTPSESEYNNCFTDVKNGWFAPYVCFAKSKGWIEGYGDGTFKPASTINKAEAMKMLIEVFGISLVAGDTNPYSDVDKNAWFAKYVNTAKNYGLLEEKNTQYLPGSFIKRGEISENIYRLLLDKKYRQKYVDAMAELTCEMLSDGSIGELDASAWHGTTLEIFKKHGFPVDNDKMMEGITGKFEQDLLVETEISASQTSKCPQQLDSPDLSDDSSEKKNYIKAYDEFVCTFPDILELPTQEAQDDQTRKIFEKQSFVFSADEKVAEQELAALNEKYKNDQEVISSIYNSMIECDTSSYFIGK